MNDSLEQAVAGKLPLAQSVLLLLRHAFDTPTLDAVFQSHRGRNYQNAISFPLCCELMAETLVQSRGSVNRTFQNAIDDGRLSATPQAMYGKIRRIPIALSLAGFDAVSARLRQVAPQSLPRTHPLPKSLTSFWGLCFDGKKLKSVVKKLKPLRGLKGNVFGGKLLVVQDMATR